MNHRTQLILTRRVLVIVDEASLAGTFALDALTAQATAADAKVLLVGDHAQLSAVDAGGAFNLLTERGRPAVLTSLWRFSHRWEARATSGLRTGNPAVLDIYAAHERISAGPAEVMCEAAYTAWQGDTENGTLAILLAADAHTVEALNTRAHNDRVTEGLVANEGLTTADGTVIGVGDRVVTRSNNRRLRLRGSFVRNGDLWRVTRVGGDGSLVVTRLRRTGAHTPTNPDMPADARGDVVVLPADYVTTNVDLGYATTTHRAQGITVDHAHVLAGPGMVRENLYVAMTRGRHANHVYVAVDDVDPTCDYLSDPHATPAGRDVLERILATSGAERSATQTITTRQNEAGSLKRLQPIRLTLLADAVAHHWTATLHDVGLTPEQVDAVIASPECGPLLVALERGTTLGRPMDHLLRDLIAASPLGENADPAGDIAAVLHARVQAWLHTQVDNFQAITTTPRAEDLPPDTAETLRQVDELIAARIHALTDHAITTHPAWLTTLGPRPDDDPGTWLQQVAAIAAHRDYADGPTLIRAAEPPHPPLAPPVAAPDAHDWSRS